MLTLDSSILQFVPKGSYYNNTDEQLQQIEQSWDEFFKFDRVIFTLTTLLKGTSYSKGRMFHILLSNPIKYSDSELLPLGLNDNFETEVILYNLRNDDMPRSLKNLIMLTGGKKNKETNTYALKRVNNRKTRKIILSYLFERDNNSLEAMAISFKQKMKKLITHALGKQFLNNILNGDEKVFNKYIGRYNKDCKTVIDHIFDKEIKWKKITRFPKIKEYYALRDIASKKDADKFISFIKTSKLPIRTVMGFRNMYKLDVNLSDIYEESKLSNKESIQLEKAASKSGIKIKVDYEKNDIYDLWKTFYNKVLTNDNDNLDKISDAIEKRSLEKIINFGKSTIILDSSGSMSGSKTRPLHPFLTGLSLICVLDNIDNVIWAGGIKKQINNKNISNIVIPCGKTCLWKSFLEAMKSKPETIIFISDGYENSIKGLLETVYDKFIKLGEKINIVHINPVYSSEMKGARKILNNIDPIVLNDYKFIETEFVFKRLAHNRDEIKKLLSSKYKQLIERR